MSQSKVVLPGSFRTHPAIHGVVSDQYKDKIETLTLILRADANNSISKSDLASVEAFVAEHGFTISHLHPESKTIKISGLLSKLARTFDVKLFTSSESGPPTLNEKFIGKSYRTRTGHIMIPAELDGIIVGVFGFDKRPIAKPHLQRYDYLKRFNTRKTAPEPTSFTPPQVAKAYNFPTNTGAGQTIAIIELGGGYEQSDLTRYWKEMGVTQAGVTSISVDGATNIPGGDPDGADGEVCLDIQVCGAVAPGAKIVVYFAPNTDQGFLDAILQAVHDTVNKPSVISISWGGPEVSWTAQSMNAFNTAFYDASLLGISVFVASGDNGSSDGVGDGQNHVDFPASAPWAIGCGGTYMPSGISSEAVWNDGDQGGASGGGESVRWKRPVYQAGIALTGKDRGVPDVAGNADPNSGYQVIVDGQTQVIGGTSAVAPLWAALIAICNQELSPARAGFISNFTYADANKSKSFNDITKGNNGAFKAQPGWDGCTGWGSPNGQNLLTFLKSKV